MVSRLFCEHDALTSERSVLFTPSLVFLNLNSPTPVETHGGHRPIVWRSHVGWRVVSHHPPQRIFTEAESEGLGLKTCDFFIRLSNRKKTKENSRQVLHSFRVLAGTRYLSSKSAKNQRKSRLKLPILGRLRHGRFRRALFGALGSAKPLSHRPQGRGVFFQGSKYQRRYAFWVFLEGFLYLLTSNLEP